MITIPLWLLITLSLLSGFLLGFVVLLAMALINDGPNNWEGKL